VLRQYPEEKELHERVRLYLNVCQRQATPRVPAPQTIDERLYAATLAINGGQYDQAIVHLRLVRDEDPDNDHAIYMLAVAHAQRDEHAEAVAHLERAIALNPENRALARNDPDLERVVAELSRQIGVDLTLPAPAPKPTPARMTPARVAPATPATIARPVAGPTPVAVPAPKPVVPAPPKPDPIRERALLTIAALERFLDAVHVVRVQQHA